MTQPLFSQSVGECGSNQQHDIALLQAAFKSIKNPDATLGDRTWWPEDITGTRSPKLGAAIKAFQTTHDITPADGCIRPRDKTERKLQDLLPRERKHMRCFPNSKEVYCFNPQGHLQAASNKALEEDPNLPEGLARNIRSWLDDYSRAQGHCVIAEAKTKRASAVEYVVKCPEITLLDVKGQAIRNQGISNAERRAFAASKQAQINNVGDVKIIPSNTDLVIEVGVNALKSVQGVIDSILRATAFQTLMGTIAGFSSVLSSRLEASLLADRDELVTKVKSGRLTIRKALDIFTTFLRQLTGQVLGRLADYGRQLAEVVRKTYGGLERMIEVVSGGSFDPSSPELNSAGRQKVGDAIEIAARHAGLNYSQIGSKLKGIGSKFFVISLAISAYKILTAENMAKAAVGEAASIGVDAVIGGVAATAGIVAGAVVGTAAAAVIVPIILGVGVALLFQEDVDQLKNFVQDQIIELFPGPLLA